MRRCALVERLESRQMLAGDVGFLDSLPTAEEARFGNIVMTVEGREACLAFKATGGGEGEGTLGGEGEPSGAQAAPSVDLSSAIVQQP